MIFEKDLREICRFCGGEGFTYDDFVRLYKICKYCRGNGKLHWTENINGITSMEVGNQTLAKRLDMRNVELLIDVIKKIFRKHNTEAIISIEEVKLHGVDPFSYKRISQTILRK